MTFNPDINHRRSIRLQEYDYTAAGAYFVTFCTFQRECLFGEVIGGEMQLNEVGHVVEEWWGSVTKHFDGISLDQYTIMPNHFHGIVTIVGAGSPRPDATRENAGGETPVKPGGETPVKPGGETPVKPGGETPPLRCPTLGQIVGYFKYQSTKCINQLRDNLGCPVWQRNYYEHIIRNEADLDNIRQYIANNPLKWEQDENNPVNV